MEAFGYTFFDAFIHWVGELKWVLAAVFTIFIIKQILAFRPEERLFTLLMFSYFFFVITSFWILKPIKKIVLVSHYQESSFDLFGWMLDGAQAEQVAKILNMVVALLAATAFSYLSRSLRRQQLTYVFSAFFIVGSIWYGFALDDPGGFTVWSFYLYGDLYSTLMVVTFFAFLNDSVTPAAAKRLYGLIALGGLLGGVFGTSTVAGADVSSSAWLWIVALIAVALVVIAMIAGGVVRRNPPPEVPTSDQSQANSSGNPAVEGARLALRSPYLLSIVAIVGLYEMVSNIMDFQFTSAGFHFLEPDLAKAHIKNVFAFTNWTALFVQLLLTSFVMTRYGVGVALLFLPLAALLGSAGFLVFPVLLFGSLLNTADNGFSYSINQSAKEVLYVPTTRDEKYKAKAFIDMFVQRFAKALAVGLNLAMTTIFVGFEGIRWLSLITVLILVLWVVAARYAGRAFKEREDAATAS